MAHTGPEVTMLLHGMLRGFSASHSDREDCQNIFIITGKYFLYRTSKYSRSSWAILGCTSGPSYTSTDQAKNQRMPRLPNT